MSLQRFRIALIGSRVLHKQAEYADDVQFMHKLCYRLAEIGVRFTSGLCEEGLDAIAQKEFSRALCDQKASLNQFEVYVYDIRAVHKSTLPNRHLALPMNSRVKHELYRIAENLHPAWANCDDYARKQHARNIHQILGYHLDRPVNAVVTWCVTDKNGNPTGGTSTAIKLAKQHDIPVFNFYGVDRAEMLDKLNRFLRSTLLMPNQQQYISNIYK